MKIAFWTVTRGAGNTAKNLKEILDKKISDFEITVFTMKKYEVENTNQIENFTQKLEENFSSFDGHIFIMASGIVVRKISKLLKGKDIDPAVLLIDEGKHFVISLLSGHLGGANELTYKISSALNLVPVITTSSDITGKIAVDTIAQKLNAELEDLKSAKDVTSLIVDGKKVDILLPANVNFQNKKNNAEGTIIISNKKNVEITRIFPKNLILGIGCKKDIKKEDILNAIEDILEKNNLSSKSIKHFATVDVKENELGLVEAVKTFNKNLKIISREEIIKIENLFEGSDFVKKNIGVRAVSEPVSLLSSDEFMKEYEKIDKDNFDLVKKLFEEKYKENFIEMKARYNGITISIYEEEDIYG
ncbi:MAG: cobalt-precorrin 5A hydrolase [Fusobacteriales bacterium]|nr:MAG: cobalt-precorrin 5A hydrolase [Fusobacteriales bacterium]